MNPDEICFLPAWKMADMVKRQELPASEIVEAFISRIDKINPKINAYVTTTFDLARKQARAVDQLAKDAANIGPLGGVPTSIKDLILTAGIRTSSGSKIWDCVPEIDEVVVERLKAAGCVIMGKTNTPEIGHMAVTDNLIFGRTNNPWNLDRTSGGSSGGAAAACAAGLSPLALGSDGGGSIRIPSTFCGVFGLKPTYGRIPRWPHEGMAFRGLDCYGPITQYVQDAALMLDVMKGPHPMDRESILDDGVSYLKGINPEQRPSRLKIGFLPNLGYVKLVEPEIADIVAHAVQKFGEVGWTVEEPQFKTKNPEDPYIFFVTASAAQMYQKKMATRRQDISPNLVKMIDAGMGVGGVQLLDAMYRRYTLCEELTLLFKTYDLLVTPAMPCTAFGHGLMFPPQIAGKAASTLAFMCFTYPLNMTGMPAAAVPLALSKEHLPIAMQVIGPIHGDLKVLQAAKAFEEIAPWQDRKPPIG